MRKAQRLVGITAAALVVAGSALGAGSDAASAASAGSHRYTASHNRLVLGAELRRLTAAPAPGATLAAITKAVHSSEYTSGVPASSYTVGDLRTSGSWARVTLRPKRSAQLDPATVVLQKKRGAWHVVDLGTAEVGCESAPAATIKALKLECPG